MRLGNQKAMKHKVQNVPREPELRILSIRGQRVMLDVDLAKLYGVETRALNQAVKRNLDRFPSEFCFSLTREEIGSISQNVTSLASLKFSKNVRAFTEHGALQAANVLNSSQAAQMSLYIIRAFVKMRNELMANAAILKRLAEIDKTLLEHDSALRDVFQMLLPLMQPPDETPPRRIGFNREEEN
jgi:ORF6N domain